MRHLGSALIVCALAAGFIACSEQREGGMAARETVVQPLGHRDISCGTLACIENFLNNQCGTLVVQDDNSPYTLSGHYIVDSCSPHNLVRIVGDDTGQTPELDVTGQYYYDPYSYHAALHIVENTNNNQTDLVQNVIIKTQGYMDGNGAVAGIQWEATNVELRDATFGDFGTQTTTHFLGVLDLVIDNIVQSAHQEFVIGDEDWCGDPNCSGPGPIICADGSSISNSELNGWIMIDAVAYLDNTLTISNNDPLTHLVLDVDNQGSGSVVADLQDNTLVAGTGAAVVIRGDYEVDATGNVTTRGPCRDDALADFDTSQANRGSGALTLNSWVYDGTEYTSDTVVISNIHVDSDYEACTKTVTWTTNFPSSSVVRYGAKCTTLTQTATGSGDTVNHSVVIDLNTLPVGKFAFRVESGSPCSTTQSACQVENRDPCISQ